MTIHISSSLNSFASGIVEWLQCIILVTSLYTLYTSVPRPRRTR